MRINNVSSFFIEADRFCARVPVLNSLVGLAGLIQKLGLDLSKRFPTNPYHSHVYNKSYKEHLIISLPVFGSIYVNVKGLVNRKAAAIELVSDNPSELKNLSKKFRNDPDVVLAAVKKDGRALQFAGEDLRKNFALFMPIAKEAIKTHEDALAHCGETLQNAANFVMEATDYFPLSIQHSGETLRDMPIFIEIARKTIKKHEGALGCCGEKLQNDAGFVSEAVDEFPMSLEDAGNSLRAKPEFFGIAHKAILKSAEKRDIIFLLDECVNPDTRTQLMQNEAIKQHLQDKQLLDENGNLKYEPNVGMTRIRIAKNACES